MNSHDKNESMEFFEGEKKRVLVKLITDVGFSNVGYLIPQFFYWITDFILISFLIPDDLGFFEVVFTIVALFLILGDTRINWSITRIVAKTNQSRKRSVVIQVLKQGILVNLIIGGILAVSWIFLVLFLPELPFLLPITSQETGSLFVIIFAVYILQYFIMRIILGIIYGLRVFRYEALINILNSGLSLLIIFIIMLAAGNVVKLVYGKITAGVLASVIGSLIFFLGKRNLFISSNYGNNDTEKITTRALMSFSLPFYLSGLLGFVFNGTDRLILGYYSLKDLGIYKSAVFVLGMMTVPIALIAPSTVLVSFLAENYKTRKESIVNIVMDWVLRLSMLVMLPISAFVFFNVNLFYTVLFPTNYSQGAKFLSFLSLCGIFLALRRSECIIALGKPTDYLYFVAITSFVSISLNLILIPTIGGLGTAIAYLSAITAGTIFSLVFRRKYNLVLFPDRKYFIVYIGSLFSSLTITKIISWFLLHSLNQYSLLVVEGGLFFVIYFFIVFLAGGFTEDDIFLLRVVLTKIRRIFKPLSS